MNARSNTLALLGGLALLCGGPASATPGDPPRPNIILLMADDLGWGDPSFNNGTIPTPALDQMAANGLRFNRFYAASAVCSPTRASCLTGRNPERVGVPHANRGCLGADETPLSEVLAGVGYTCGHFGKWHLGTLTTVRADSNRGGPGSVAVYSAPWHHSYDTCFATEAKVPTYHPMRSAINGAPLPASFTDSRFYGTRYWTPPADPLTWPTAPEGEIVPLGAAVSGDDSRVIVDQVLPFIERAVAAGRPFFAVVWFHTPHKPVVDPQEVDGVDSAGAYAAAIQDLDAQVGRIRSRLGELGVQDDTMLWFCSDNGPENGLGSTGGLRGRKRSLHEGGVRVPSLLEWPALIPSARQSDYASVTSDYYPTILDALDLMVPNQKPLDGISLMPVIHDTAGPGRIGPIGFRFRASRSWVTQRYKLISKDDGATYELYDLLLDQAEQNDLAASMPQLTAWLTFELELWLTAVDADVPLRLGTHFCLGDDSDHPAACPCNNASAPGSKEGCRNTTAHGAWIEATGNASVSSDSLVLQVYRATPSELGIFVQNTMPTTAGAVPLDNGLLCLGLGTHLLRHYAPPTIMPTGTDALGIGASAQPLTQGDSIGDTQPGVTVYYQFWYRDNPGYGASCTAGANFSSGLAITWEL